MKRRAFLLLLCVIKDNLKPDMTYDSIVSKFGEPSKDIGSGIHIYVYQLTDSIEIWIGYTDKILYARHMDKNGQIINTILGTRYIHQNYDYLKPLRKRSFREFVYYFIL